MLQLQKYGYYRKKNPTMFQRFQSGLWKMDSKFLITKPNACIYCQIYKMHKHPALILNDTEILITHRYKFLGITCDSKLSFIPHIKQVRIKIIALFSPGYQTTLVYMEMKGQAKFRKNTFFYTKIPCTDLKPTINKFIQDKWQKSWDDQTHNKLHNIQDTIRYQ